MNKTNTNGNIKVVPILHDLCINLLVENKNAHHQVGIPEPPKVESHGVL